MAVKELQRDSMVAATDGSFDPHWRQAAGSWILSTRDGRKKLSGACSVDGNPETMDSYRAELEAIRSLVYYMRFLRHTHPEFTKYIRLTVWIDNVQALNHGTEGSFTTNSGSAIK